MKDFSFEINHTDCCVCGTPIIVDEAVLRRLRSSGDTFYCINGHSQSFTNSISEQLSKKTRDLEAANKMLFCAKRDVEMLTAQLAKKNKPRRKKK